MQDSKKIRAHRRAKTIKYHKRRKVLLTSIAPVDVQDWEYVPTMHRASVDNPRREYGEKGNGAFRYLPRCAREVSAIQYETLAHIGDIAYL